MSDSPEALDLESPLPVPQNHHNLNHFRNKNHIPAQNQNVVIKETQVGAEAGIREYLQVAQREAHELAKPCCC